MEPANKVPFDQEPANWKMLYNLLPYVCYHGINILSLSFQFINIIF